MNKIYHLSTCNTCQKIIKQLNSGEGFELQDIKSEAMTKAQLEAMHKVTGSYEALFSRRAMKYRGLGLNEQTLTEGDYKDWILKEYTFLKRPVCWIEGELFVGNSKKVVEAAVAKLNQ